MHFLRPSFPLLRTLGLGKRPIRPPWLPPSVALPSYRLHWSGPIIQDVPKPSPKEEKQAAAPSSPDSGPNDPGDHHWSKHVFFQRLRNQIRKPDQIPDTLDTFPSYLHPVSRRELESKALRAFGNPQRHRFVSLLSPLKDSNEYLKDLAQAMAKSLNASFLVTVLANLQELTLKPSGRLGRKKKYTPTQLPDLIRELQLAAGGRLVIHLADVDLTNLSFERKIDIVRLGQELASEPVIFTAPSFLSKKHQRAHRRFFSDIPDSQFPNIEYVSGPFSITAHILPPTTPEELASWEAEKESKRQKETFAGNMKQLQHTVGLPFVKSGLNFPLDSLAANPQIRQILSQRTIFPEHDDIIKMAIGAMTVSNSDPLQCLTDAILNWEELRKLKEDEREPAKAKKLTRYEKRFLPCLMQPGNLKIRFEDIGALENHREILKSVISLPVERPDIFGYGVLKNSSTSVLLFGPPGTGKTLLAKAVASECKANFLAITCGDIMNMFHGESEKNVQAVFSLARKMKPCVIFLDELDALFMSRSYLHSHGSREVINQLMIEWDGVRSNNDGIVVLGATNRPFDLDDAVLRRMPRKLLVDLPNEAGRLQILTLLLKEEGVDQDVSLPLLASLTKDYSGSDLKNICVAAALSAVREQLSATGGKSDSPRILTMAHFRKALNEVKASTSSESASAIELKKWDERYGEGSGRKRVLGFGLETTKLPQ